VLAYSFTFMCLKVNQISRYHSPS